MKLIATFLLTFCMQTLFAQSTDTSNQYYDVVSAHPEILPVFKDGGDLGLIKFMQENLRYPKTGECISGKVYVGFTVDTLGNVKDIEIRRGLSPAADEEALRVVKMLTFIPGSHSGQLINFRMTLPIGFTMDYKDEK